MTPNEIQITAKDIEENCIGSYYSRGVGYYNANKVKKCVTTQPIFIR